MTATKGSISAEFDYQSHYIEILDSKIHYIEAGKGDPILFIHGIPTYSYLWRNIIPEIAGKGRCIALDLIGMGLSGKPDILYTVFDHIEYIDQFIKVLGLSNLTLVLHGWGSVIGFECARRNADKVRAIAFFESHIRATTDWEMLSLPVQQLATLLNKPGASYRAIVQQNYLVEKLLPNGVLRELTKKEKEYYAKPYPTPESRKPLWQYIQDLPLGSGEGEVTQLINSYSDWLQKASMPKLMIYAVPGFITTIATVKWARQNLTNLTLIELQDALHFAQESMPKAFSHYIRDWYVAAVLGE